MNFKVIIIAAVLFLSSYQAISQIDTFQVHIFENGTALFLRENGVKKVIFNRDVDSTSTMIISETLYKPNKIDPGTSIDGLLGVKSHNNFIGVIKRSKQQIIYLLYDISSGERKLKNCFMFGPISGFLIQYELLDCFTVLQNYLEFQEKSQIIRFSEHGHIQKFKSSEKGRAPNSFYHNLVKFKK